MMWTTLQHERILPFEADVFYERFNEDQVRQIWESGIWATGFLPTQEECVKLVARYGEDVWEMSAMSDPTRNIAGMIGTSWMGTTTCTTHAEFCTAMVAMAIQESARFLASALGWED